MIIEIIIAILLGILAGTFTGLFPGIHINLVGTILLSISASLLIFFSPFSLVVFIVAMTITHTFTDFIPSVFLGAPDEDTVLAVLPGHQLLQIGRGYEAVFLSAIGSIIALPLFFIFTSIFLVTLPSIEKILPKVIPLLLITSSIILILTEKNKLQGFFIFILSGFLGLGILNSNLSQPLLPLLSGLFGASALILSIKNKVSIPNQNLNKDSLSIKEIKNPFLASIIASPLCSVLPGLGSGQAAVIGSSLIKLNEKQFIILTGIVNTLTIALSFTVLYLLEKTRTGSAVIVKELIPELTKSQFLNILFIIIIISIISFYLTLFLAKFLSSKINNINYSLLSSITLIIISLIVITFSSFYGFFTFIIASSLGIYAILSGVKRTLLMGCLIIPTIIFYI